MNKQAFDKLCMYAAERQSHAQDAPPAAVSQSPTFAGRARSAASQSAVGGAIGVLGTSAALAAGGRLLSKRVPFVGKLLNNAAVDGVKIFNPAYAKRLSAALPEAARLTAGNMKVMATGEDALRRRPGFLNRLFSRAVSPTNITEQTSRRHAALQRLLNGRQLNTQKYHAEFGEIPSDTISRAIGGVSGVASGAAGAAIGGASGFLSGGGRSE
jgi:hypothetical protein